MYSREVGREFWYDFDNQTLWNRTPEVNAAIKAAYFDHGFTLDSMPDAFVASWWTADHPRMFRQMIMPARDGIITLAEIQLRIIGEHLETPDDLRLAFEDFGQGVLFDDRPPRPPGRHIHMMDGTPSSWVGYRRWTGFLRAAEIVEHPRAEAIAHLKRCVLLAWAVQTEAEPNQQSPNNPGLPAARLALLRDAWMRVAPPAQDWAFATHRFRAPSLEELANAGRYTAVQAMLDAAAGDGEPDHGGLGRFWRLPHADFVEQAVFGEPLIAPPGPDRGERSALVQVLRGTLSGFPQMPLNRPPMSNDQIAFISRWIDAGAREF